MAHIEKINRVWVKQEKQIIKLLYKKGLIDTLNPISIEEFYWQFYKRDKIHKKYRYKNGTKWINYLPEIHFCTYDYWGEFDEHAVVDVIIENLIWMGIEERPIVSNPTELSTFKYKGRRWFIKYLKTLPTVKCDSKINKVLYLKKE